MIKLGKKEVFELAKLFALANTPGTLFHALRAHPLVQRLRTEMGSPQLAAALNELTARSKRTEVSLGLAYAVLVALVTNPFAPVPKDAPRLSWGRAFVDLANKSSLLVTTNILDASPPRADSESGPGASLILPVPEGH